MSRATYDKNSCSVITDTVAEYGTTMRLIPRFEDDTNKAIEELQKKIRFKPCDMANIDGLKKKY